MANQMKIGEISFCVGDTIRIDYKIIEKEKVSGVKKKEQKEEVRERFQPFEGVVLAIRGTAENQSFTMRKIGSLGVSIERIFPANSPWIGKIKVIKKGNVRRAKLYYLRNKKG